MGGRVDVDERRGGGTVVVHHGGLGDGVLIWPLLRALSRRGPVALACRWSGAKLAGAWIEGVEAVDGESAEFSRLFVGGAAVEAGDALRARFAAADRVVSFVSSGRDAWAANVEALAPRAARCHVRSRPASEDPPEPIARFHERQLADQGLVYEPMDPPLRRAVDAPVVLHPGSGGTEKCWPIERWEALAGALEGIGRPIAVALGEAELERWPEGRRKRWAGRYDCYMPATPLELSRVIAGASVYVGNDAGPTHLAAQLGVATVALFGPTDPRVWGPRGPAVTIIAPRRLRAMDWLPVEAVVEAIARW